MVRNRIYQILFGVVPVLLLASGCRHKYENPITKDTQQPDKVLFDTSVDDIEHGRYERARLTLQTMMNTYDTSEYLAKAKLAVADSWKREGGAHGMAQAEAEYKDFILFYPNMEESAEAQYKICEMQYQQMDKSDRDSVHARLGDAECKDVLQKWPELRPPVDKHPSVQIRGGSSSGIALVSFNSSAFESFGWERNQNAPVCRDCAEGYTTGLRRLISNRYPDPLHPGEFLPRRFVGLTGDTVAVFWADADSKSLDWFADIFEKPDPEAVKSLIESPHKGSKPSKLSARFYCLLISGGQGRAIVRGMHTGTVAEVELNVAKYFSNITRFSEGPLPVFFLLRSLAIQGKADNLPPSLAGEVFLAILFGLKYPFSLLSSAVQRCRAEQKVSRERAALIQLYFQRNKEREELTMGLNRESPDPGYRLGRLLAVLEKLQGEANKGLNKTIVDRYYGAASTRPVTVFPSLIHLAQHHAGKARNPGFFQKEIGDVLDAVESFPPHLSLEEQGLFALGYYHQRQEYFKKRESAPSQEVTGGEEGESINE
ncbi:MAG: type I-C CRISPR-associated protein Cas8c/Csd1 [Ignavibacteriota bacterium]